MTEKSRDGFKKSVNKSKVIALKDSSFGKRLIKNKDMSDYKFRGHSIVLNFKTENLNIFDKLCFVECFIYLVKKHLPKSIKIIKTSLSFMYFFGKDETATINYALYLVNLSNQFSLKNKKLKIVIGICDGYSYIFKSGSDSIDFFGYNVNVSSKLAKLVGKPNQVLISNDFFTKLEKSRHKLGMKKTIKLSGNDLSYYELLDRDTKKIDIKSYIGELKKSKRNIEIEMAKKYLLKIELEQSPTKRMIDDIQLFDKIIDIDEFLLQYKMKAVIFKLDMSRFTSHSNKYGILETLKKIIKMQELLLPKVEKYGGKVQNFEGDDMLVLLSNQDKAHNMAEDFIKTLEDYNKSLEKKKEMTDKNDRHIIDRYEDDKIFIKIGLSYGNVLNIEHNVIGNIFYFSHKLSDDLAKRNEILFDHSMNNVTLRQNEKKRRTYYDNHKDYYYYKIVDKKSVGKGDSIKSIS